MSDRELLTECLEALTHDAAQRTFAGGVKMSQLAIKLRAALAAPSEDIETLRRDAERYRWMKQNVKRIPPAWDLVGWDAAIDAAMQEVPR